MGKALKNLEKRFKNKRILVTGGTGFFGSHLVKILENLGAFVKPIGRNGYDHNYNPTKVFSDDSYDYIIHGAAMTGAGTFTLEHPAEQFEINSLIHVNTLKCWNFYQPNARLIGINSSCSYPDKPVLKEEDFMQGALHSSVDVYGTSKILMVKGIEAYKRQYARKGTSLTFATLYGENDIFDPSRSHCVAAIIKKFCDAVKNGEPEVEIWGDGSQIRELVYASDQALGVLMCSEYDGEILNVGSGVEVQICKLAETLKELTGFQGEIVYNPTKFVGVKRKVLDISKAKELYGWTVDNQLTSLEDGLLKTIEYYKGLQNVRK